MGSIIFEKCWSVSGGSQPLTDVRGSGRPYFVMELVRGIPITEFCDQRALPIRERLELFNHVCAAVQHAHLKGIIHRDLKPTNVLVTLHDEEPVVKVIDFGIAKATGQKLTEKTLFTGFAQMMGTPQYMSPEQTQMSGLDVDTRSDIYSLGVLLYELLTGTTPFDTERLRTAPFDEIRRIIREEEPPKPSTRISTLGQAATTMSTQRRSDPKRLSQLYRGELDWIVMKALEKDRNRRYESAGAFAADVQRYLHDEPVQACPPSAWYRFRKLARRNKARLTVAAVLTLAAVSLLVGALYHNATLRSALRTSDEKEREARQAVDDMHVALRTSEEKKREAAQAVDDMHVALRTSEEKKRVARQAVDDMYIEVSEKWFAFDPRAKAIRQQFLLKALHFYEEFAKEEDSDPDRRLEAAKAQWRVANIYRMLGQHADAEKAYRVALDALKRLAAESPAIPKYRDEWEGTLIDFGSMLGEIGRRSDAEKAFRQAFDLAQDLSAKFPDVPSYRRDLVMAQFNLALCEQSTGRVKEAEQDYERGLEVLKTLSNEQLANIETRRILATVHLDFGLLLKQSGRHQKAEQSYRQAVEDFQKLAAEFPAKAEFRFRLATTLSNLGHLLILTGQLDEGRKNLRGAMELGQKLTEENPTVPEYRDGLAKDSTNFAIVLMQASEFPEAEKILRRAQELRQKLVDDFPHVAAYRVHFADTLHNLGYLFENTDRLPDALAMYRRSLEFRQKLAESDPGVPDNLRDLAMCQNSLGNLLQKMDRLEEAERALRQCVKLRQKLTDSSPATPNDRLQLAASYTNLGNVLRVTDRVDEAEQNYQKALQLAQRLAEEFPKVPDFQNLLGVSWDNLAAILDLRGKLVEAKQLRERALGYARAALKGQPKHPGYQQTVSNLLRNSADNLVKQGQHGEAVRAAAELVKQFPESWSVYQHAAEFAARCVPLAEKDSHLSEVQRRKTAQMYAEQAMGWLGDAVAKGLKDVGELTKNESFDSLRGRADFQELVRTVEKKAKMK